MWPSPRPLRDISPVFSAAARPSLTLTDPDDVANTGIEIIARPPGKRATSLSLLSGGERALTAAALIFSLLSVSPTPFCILDEVDAALDEANIGRFREVLSELSGTTQFILITHNRGSIEAANTIYGVSMGADSASQCLSLKLDGGLLAAVSLSLASWPRDEHPLGNPQISQMTQILHPFDR